LKKGKQMQMFERLKNKTVLVVEDQRVIRENLAGMLRIFFKDVYTAINGIDGIDKAEEYFPDIIITDLKMPHMDGYEMLRELKERSCSAYTIIVSAHTDTELLIEAINNKVDRYIIKPVNEEKLFEAFDAYVSKLDSSKDEKLELQKDVIIDLYNSKIENQGQEHHINKKELLLLKLLCSSPEQTFSYEEIENQVWGSISMSLSALRSVVRDIRKKLGSKYLKNVSGVGYRLK
jgi:DNA-binding response OmpR family regulator